MILVFQIIQSVWNGFHWTFIGEKEGIESNLVFSNL